MQRRKAGRIEIRTRVKAKIAANLEAIRRSRHPKESGVSCGELPVRRLLPETSRLPSTFVDTVGSEIILLCSSLTQAKSERRHGDSFYGGGPEVALAGQMSGGECAGADHFSRAQRMRGKAADDSGAEFRQT